MSMYISICVFMYCGDEEIKSACTMMVIDWDEDENHMHTIATDVSLSVRPYIMASAAKSYNLLMLYRMKLRMLERK